MNNKTNTDNTMIVSRCNSLAEKAIVCVEYKGNKHSSRVTISHAINNKVNKSLIIKMVERAANKCITEALEDNK